MARQYKVLRKGMWDKRQVLEEIIKAQSLLQSLPILATGCREVLMIFEKLNQMHSSISSWNEEEKIPADLLLNPNGSSITPVS